MKIFFKTGEKPSKEVLDAIHEIDSRHWDKETQSWEIDDSEKDKLPLESMPNIEFYQTKEDIKNNNPIDFGKSKVDESALDSPEKEKAKNDSNWAKLSPALKEAISFKNGYKDENGKTIDNISVKALYEYIHNQVKFYSSLAFKGTGNDIKDNIEHDKLLGRSFAKTDCARLETKIPEIMKAMISVSKDHHLRNQEIYESSSKQKVNQDIITARLTKANRGLHANLDKELEGIFPAKFMQEIKAAYVSRKEDNPGKVVAEDFLNGKTTNLTVGAVKSHVMTIAGQLLDNQSITADEIKAQLDQDKILNADLSKTDIAKMAPAMQNIKESVFDIVMTGKEQIANVDANKPSFEERKEQISSIKYKARINASSLIPNTNILDNEKAMGNKQQASRGFEMMMNKKDLLYIVSTREATEEREVIKSIDGYSYNGANNYWTVPKKNVKGVEALKNMKVYASREDIKNDKVMSAGAIEKLVGKAQVNAETKTEKQSHAR